MGQERVLTAYPYTCRYAIHVNPDVKLTVIMHDQYHNKTQNLMHSYDNNLKI